MNELLNLVKDVVYGAVGAVATVVEKSGDIAQTCVEKGKETVEQGRATAEEWKRKWQESCEASAQEEEIDVSAMTPEEREALRRKLDEADKADAACPCCCHEAEEAQPSNEVQTLEDEAAAQEEENG